MADIPIYKELLKLGEEDLPGDQTYKRLTELFQKFRSLAPSVCTELSGINHSQQEAHNAETFRNLLPMLKQWVNALEHGAILPTGGGWPELEQVNNNKTGESSLRPTRRGTLFYKRFEQSPDYFDLVPECEFSYKIEESHKGRKGYGIKLTALPQYCCTKDDIVDYAYSLISFAFYQLLVKYSNSGVIFHHKVCLTCGRSFWCTKRTAKFCSSKCESAEKKRGIMTKARPHKRRIPGIKGYVSESVYRAWLRSRPQKSSEKWNQAWYASRKK